MQTTLTAAKRTNQPKWWWRNEPPVQRIYHRSQNMLRQNLLLYVHQRQFSLKNLKPQCWNQPPSLFWIQNNPWKTFSICKLKVAQPKKPSSANRKGAPRKQSLPTKMRMMTTLLSVRCTLLPLREPTNLQGHFVDILNLLKAFFFANINFDQSSEFACIVVHMHV